MEDLASRYSFHLIGDSTSRRLGESFVSLFTGVGSIHPVFQGDLDFSSGNLKVRPRVSGSGLIALWNSLGVLSCSKASIIFASLHK